MKRYLVVYNPIAGKNNKKNWVDKLVKEIEKSGGRADLVTTEYVGHAREISYRYAKDYDVLVSAGGDGTLNELATGILEAKSKVVLGILPIGSGNDYYRNFASPKDIKKAIDTIINGKIKMVDIGKGNSGRYLLNIASIGLDCLTVKKAKKLKKIFGGSLGYLFSLIYSIVVFKKQNLKINIDDREIEAKSVLYCFGKGKSYGGGIRIMPWVDSSDGVFHMVNVVDVNKFILILLSPSIALWKHTVFKKYVKTYKAKKIKVESEKTYDFNLDGEILENSNFIEYECIENALGILV